MYRKGKSAALPPVSHRRVAQPNQTALQELRRGSGSHAPQQVDLRSEVQRQRLEIARYRQTIQRLTLASTAPDNPFIADSTPFFDRCEDSLMSLHYAGRMGLMDLFNWSSSDEFLKTFNYITWVRPEMTGGPGGGDPTPGYLSDPCADPNGYEFGTTEFTVSGFGRYGRKGPVREILHPTRYCATDPRYRLDGRLVTNEFEWDLAFIMDVLKQDLFRDIVSGNASTAGQFDGLLQLINTGYPSPMLNSMVFEWAGNDLNGTGGGTKTLNGDAISASATIIDLLLAIYRRLEQRIQWSPMLSTQGFRTGQVVLVMPHFLTECLLDAFTCWSVCPGGQYNETNLNTYEARNFRVQLNGGMFGSGAITLDGDTIPLYSYDWETMRGNGRGDIFFLVRAVGNVNLWEAEFLDAGSAAAEMRAEGHDEYFSTDGGRVIGVTDVDNLCRITKAWIRPRLILRAPWLQARIMNVECDRLLDPLSPDPLSSFYPMSSFAPERRTVG